MKRGAPMKRAAFRSKAAPAQRPVKTMEYEPRPRVAAVARHDGKARMVVAVPKFNYVRDERLRDMCRAMACQHCGAAGPDAGITWAHSNWAVHGHGRSVKASDVFVASLCQRCHVNLDQGRHWDAAMKWQVWTTAHVKTIATALQLGLWPQGITVPQVDYITTATTEEAAP